MSNHKAVMNAIYACGKKATAYGGDFGTAEEFYDEPRHDLYFRLEHEFDERDQFYSLMKKSGFHSGEYKTPSDWCLCFDIWMVVYVDGDIYIKNMAPDPDDQEPPEGGKI